MNNTCDQVRLVAARNSIRESFREKASIEPADVPDAIKVANDVATILRQNLVQGRKKGDRYELRIHKDTERGDNDTVKFPGGKTVKIDGKKCTDR
ncbi:uncharacterized protein F4807DRAFT_458278 [Annulohypoxylon truncatum]|uniref:uncharacterized protein n=1 Tax=Annulohypoxylon truncatum TaxID=327061 RepID=UPI002008B467|nr:uncharacterized protein F4807DRAFT_458278 [Annulohypoxylon truncatum]KAI1212077.1 hypothetical protein F4807DRAFT_458278 [Annulohypoxylon truncatum]